MADTSKDELVLLGDDDVEAFSGSQADLEGAYRKLIFIFFVLNGKMVEKW